MTRSGRGAVAKKRKPRRPANDLYNDRTLFRSDQWGILTTDYNCDGHRMLSGSRQAVKLPISHTSPRKYASNRRHQAKVTAPLSAPAPPSGVVCYARKSTVRKAVT